MTPVAPKGDDCKTCKWHKDEKYMDYAGDDYNLSEHHTHECRCPLMTEETRETQHDEWCPDLYRYDGEVMTKCEFYAEGEFDES
jgi:hypothetical protein